MKNTGPEIRSKVFFLALQFISVGSWVSTKPTDTQCHTSLLPLRGFAAKMRSQRERTLQTTSREEYKVLLNSLYSTMPNTAVGTWKCWRQSSERMWLLHRLKFVFYTESQSCPGYLNNHALHPPELVPCEKLEGTSKLTHPQKSLGNKTASKSGNLGRPCQNHPAGGM